jgi:hypothetical protein
VTAAKLASLSLACVATLACSHASSIRDPESLGYGPAPGRDLAHGYGDAKGPPFERLAPTAWPLDEQPRESSWAGVAPVLEAPPIVASDDTRQLCVHVVEFLLADSGEPLDVAVLADTCHLYARTEKLARTAEQWQRFSTCMLAANTEAAFDSCEDEHPSSLAEPNDEHGREREVCQHLVMTTLYEQVGSDANLPAIELERFRPVIGECVDGLITKDQPKRSPEDYAALLDCVLEQSTSAAMEACE